MSKLDDLFTYPRPVKLSNKYSVIEVAPGVYRIRSKRSVLTGRFILDKTVSQQEVANPSTEERKDNSSNS